MLVDEFLVERFAVVTSLSGAGFNVFFNVRISVNFGPSIELSY